MTVNELIAALQALPPEQRELLAVVYDNEGETHPVRSVEFEPRIFVDSWRRREGEPMRGGFQDAIRLSYE